MNKIISITSENSQTDWKKVIDGTDDTYITLFQNTKIDIELDLTTRSIVFDFQKGFHPKIISVNDVETPLDRNTACLEVPVIFKQADKIAVQFKESYDPYKRIFIYNIFAK